ncbi:Restriction endonuclease BsobI [Chthonomonas calidirosea]|uniref:Type II site-specific deoxyribonuclease BsobI n=1 Tax=Chthonomonas calidirosea (strain DSM 23976 / ICMP 18418 / T49) TaxID=1303518 RepID=S0EWR4_CHTCT|nr:type II restriction endonuclease [Chthonomonas calidirosea]CCW34780.1 type II site-specific deoxyribonuclease BsobI [Chthonomonas calidirosea T49]CEK13817.1 Restriction endonuclease BsobI [Chthonomonas calidirosea]
MIKRPYHDHLESSEDLVTTYEATRTGFVALALEKNRRATPFVVEARALQEAASKAKTPIDLLNINGIETGLLTAAGLSDKALVHLQSEDKIEAIKSLIKNFLEPAGEKFVEELVYRFLLTRGDALGGSMRNIGGALAQRKITRAIVSTLRIAGIEYRWQHLMTRQWIDVSGDDAEIELSLRGLSWRIQGKHRTLIYNLTVPLVKSNVDMCLFSLDPQELQATEFKIPESYFALGELKGGIDPAGADEHWKTARAAIDRIRQAFSKAGYSPHTFFIGAAIERRMADEIWNQLETGLLSNAANLNNHRQVASISRWLCGL